MLCAIIIVDAASTNRLLRVRQIAERFGYPPKKVHGHITLATYTGNDEEGFISSCKAILSKLGKFPVYYDKVEAWESMSGVKSFIVAVPRKEYVIVTLQKEISRDWATDLNEWTREDNWNPHTSLIHVPGIDISDVAIAMQTEFDPFVAQIDRIEFTRVYENEGKWSYEIADFVELQ